jgi:hypothetical protein
MADITLCMGANVDSGFALSHGVVVATLTVRRHGRQAGSKLLRVAGFTWCRDVRAGKGEVRSAVIKGSGLPVSTSC